MKFRECPVVFRCEGERLAGIVSVPETPAERGVVIVVGGPQYRVGSHRQFTLLARALAEEGTATIRFDYRGMGDSEGEARGFEDVGADIRASVDQLMSSVPHVRQVVLWGLCDAASAALFYAQHDARVAGLVLCNPWVRTDAGVAKTQLKHYYASRFVAPAFWAKLARGEINVLESGVEFVRDVCKATMSRRSNAEPGSPPSLPHRMARALSQFDGKVLLVLSGKDLTAAEFCDAAKASAEWRGLLAAPRVTRVELPEADHTLSRAQWRTAVEERTGQWLRGW